MNCAKCGKQLSDRDSTVWNAVKGYERKRGSVGGTNHIALRTPLDEYICAVCMQMLLDGVDPGQQSLI